MTSNQILIFGLTRKSTNIYVQLNKILSQIEKIITVFPKMEALETKSFLKMIYTNFTSSHSFDNLVIVNVVPSILINSQSNKPLNSFLIPTPGTDRKSLMRKMQ